MTWVPFCVLGSAFRVRVRRSTCRVRSSVSAPANAEPRASNPEPERRTRTPNLEHEPGTENPAHRTSGISMFNAQPDTFDVTERLLQRFGNHHRPVPSAGAADGHRQVALPFLHVLRERKFQKGRELVDELH